MEKECLQFIFGPTPCFRDVSKTVCSLDFCPTQRYLEQNPDLKPWDALHTHCVMRWEYGRQTFCEEGKGEFIISIVSLRS